MKGRQEVSGTVLEFARVLERMQKQLGQIEERISSIETRLEQKGASDSRIWAAPRGSVLGAQGLSGVQVSGSNAPASVMLESKEMLLSSTDEQMVNLLRARGAVCAEDVRAHFKYKGKNAASARLNRLAGLGVLEKQQAGRRVYYRMRN